MTFFAIDSLSVKRYILAAPQGAARVFMDGKRLDRSVTLTLHLSGHGKVTAQ